MTPSELLERAADTIETYGHHRGGFGDTDRGMCILGAMNYVETNKPSLYDHANSCRDAAYSRLSRRIGWRAVHDWSDNAPTQEVLDTLRKAAKDARLEEEGLTS